MGVVNVLFSVYLLTKQPWNYFLYHSFKNTIYLVKRYFNFKSKKHSWFLTEFCYVVNFLIFAYIGICMIKKFVPALAFLKPHLDPFGPLLFRVGFTWSMGPVAISIAFFRNALVFHSIDHMTILAIHIGPPLVCYSFRFYHEQLEAQWPDTFHLGIGESLSWEDSFRSLLLMPTILYFCLWLLPYALIQFVIKAKEIKEQGQITMISDLPHLKNLPEGDRPFEYCKLHACSCIVAFSFSQLLWRSCALTTCYLLSLFAISIWNGATFYFEVFGGEYVYLKELKKREEKAKQETASSIPDSKLAPISNQ